MLPLMTYYDWTPETAQARERRIAEERRREEDRILAKADEIRARRQAEARAN